MWFPEPDPPNPPPPSDVDGLRCLPTLPILYFSPIMELGMDIADLNTVNKRELRAMLNSCEVGSLVIYLLYLV
jgi:hypothetical protein